MKRIRKTFKAILVALLAGVVISVSSYAFAQEGYSLETKGNIPMHIYVLPLKKGVTKVGISISAFGDKHYVELFYSLVDDNLPKKAAVGKEKTG
jgi:hypothetical protein